MRINKYLAQSTGLSRRAADEAIQHNRVKINDQRPLFGQEVADTDKVTLDDKTVRPPELYTTILLNKPAGYVVSREGQGSETVYDLLPAELHHIKPVGRLDKDSSGLLLMTDDGQLANQLTHPRYQKIKVYEVELDRPLTAQDLSKIETGVQLEDGPSRFDLQKSSNDKQWIATLQEGRNRQIRRTFDTLGYRVEKLHRTHFGDYDLTNLSSGQWKRLGDKY